MSYFLLAAGKAHIAGINTSLVKKAERQTFVDAAALLRRASSIASDTDATIEAARQEAVQTGYAAGLAAAENELAEAMHGFADAIARIEQYHAAQVAEAAYAATVAIIGELENGPLVRRLVSQVLARQKEQTGLTVHVAPELLPALEAALGNVPVIANPKLGRNECHVITANGRIIASLPVQLAVLRDRWGLKAETACE
jgi:flagellar biosynthesis/type III secretory pathway protein FliH